MKFSVATLSIPLVFAGLVAGAAAPATSLTRDSTCPTTAQFVTDFDSLCGHFTTCIGKGTGAICGTVSGALEILFDSL